jgi:hypothetical protein
MEYSFPNQIEQLSVRLNYLISDHAQGMPKGSSRTHRLSGEFLILCLVASMLTVTLWVVLALPLALATTSSTNTTNYVNSTNASVLQNNNETCSTWIGIASEGSSENNTDIACMQKVLNKCQRFDVALGYVLGSMRVSIKGAINNSGNCSLNLQHEIERGLTKMTCMIPLAKMSTWTNWKRGDGLDAVEQIIKYCTVK